MDPKKIEAILECPRSTIVTEVRSFLGSQAITGDYEGVLQDSSAFDKANSEKY